MNRILLGERGRLKISVSAMVHIQERGISEIKNKGPEK